MKRGTTGYAEIASLPVCIALLLVLVLGSLPASSLTKGCNCQDQGLIELPKVNLNKPEPPQECGRALERATALVSEIEAKIAELLKASIREAVAKRDKSDTEPEAWDAAATLAYLDLRPDVALWAELNALKLEWRSDFAVQAGVYLVAQDKNDDAKLLLHCAYSGGNRSPYLLEALANVYSDTGDKAKAILYIEEASQEAPEDDAIQVEKTLFQTGKPPAQPSATQDPVDTALAELREHANHVMAAFKRSQRLKSRVQAAYFGQTTEGPDAGIAERRKGYDDMIASLKEPARLAKLTAAQIAQQYPGTPPAVLRTHYRNMFFYAAIKLYMSMTENLVTLVGPATIDEGFDVAFWAGPMGIDTVQYARMIKERKDFTFKGIALGISGYRWEDWGGAYFKTLYTYANDKRAEDHRQCTRDHPNNVEAEKACMLEVDRKYCATVRLLHKEWVTVTEAQHQRLAGRFDDFAAAALMDAGVEVGDAYAYAARYAKEINARLAAQGSALAQQFNRQAQEWMKELNKQYKDLVDMTVWNGSGGTAERMKHEADTYRIYRDNARTSIDNYGKNIEELCEQVDRRALEQLVEEHKKAVSQMLWERLVRDLHLEYKPALDCSLSLGEYLSVSVDSDGNRKYSGKWSFMKKKFGAPGQTPNGLDGVGIGGSAGIGFGKDGQFKGVTVSAAGGGGAGVFSGKGGVTFGAQWDSKTNTWTYPTKISASLGVGLQKEVRGQKVGFT